MRTNNLLGFTLIEILTVLCIGCALLGIVTINSSNSMIWSKQEVSKKDLVTLNAAIDAFKSNFGPIPNGANNEEHHNNVIAILKQAGLLTSSNISINKLQSIGNGYNFTFTKYFDVDAPKLASTNSPELVATWKTKISNAKIDVQVD